MKLLTRDQLYILNERTVHWDNSFLGILTKGVSNAFTWLGTGVKGKIQESKINSLVMQWGAEYVKALQAFDLNQEVSNQYPEEDTTSGNDTSSNNNSTQITGDNLENLESLLKLINGLNDDSKEFKKHFSNKTMINLNTLKEYLDKLLDDVKYDDDVFIEKMKELNKVVPNQEAINAFNKLVLILRVINSDINEDSTLYQFLQKEFPEELPKLVPNESKWPELKQKMGNLVMVIVSNIASYLNNVKKTIPSNPTPDNNPEQQSNTISASESLIKEAKEFKIPKKIEDLLPKSELEKLEKIPGIKEKTFKKINIKTLNTLKYEAEFLINKAKNNGKNGQSNSDELKRIWDIGIKNINNYFQNVIDVDLVMKSVSTGEVPDSIKKNIASQDAVTDMIPKMGLSTLNPTNAKFTNNNFYSFNINIIGQKGKTVKNAYLVISPVSDYIEELNGKTFYWHKLYGQYSYDNKSNEITRINLFEDLTYNSPMIKNFASKENSYYVAFESMRVTGTLADMWVYSNKGSLFYDGKLYQDAEGIVNDLKELDMKAWRKMGNCFRTTINARFTVDPNDISRFPGLQSGDLKDERSIASAKRNHDTIVKTLKDAK